jgi:hypothetical protein
MAQGVRLAKRPSMAGLARRAALCLNECSDGFARKHTRDGADGAPPLKGHLPAWCHVFRRGPLRRPAHHVSAPPEGRPEPLGRVQQPARDGPAGLGLYGDRRANPWAVGALAIWTFPELTAH